MAVSMTSFADFCAADPALDYLGLRRAAVVPEREQGVTGLLGDLSASAPCLRRATSAAGGSNLSSSNRTTSKPSLHKTTSAMSTSGASPIGVAAVGIPEHRLAPLDRSAPYAGLTASTITAP